MKNTDEPETMTLNDVAKYLHYSERYAREIYLEWEKYGVKAHKVGRRLLFKRVEIVRMFESLAIN